MARKITMQHIADRLGVSKYTVSQALSGKPGISEATRKQVTAMAAALGYTVAAAGAPSPPTSDEETDVQSAALPSAETARLIYIGMDERHDKEPSFWQRVKEGLEAGCRTYGLRPVFFTFSGQGKDGAEQSFPLPRPDAAGAGIAAGYIIAGKSPLAALLKLKRSGLPIVLVDHEEPLIGADAVLNANADAGRMACHHLLTQECRSLVFVGRDSFAVSFRERWWGCRLALDEAKESRRAADPQSPPASITALKKWTVPYGSLHDQTWRMALERRLDGIMEGTASGRQEELPDGIVCANDDIALFLLHLIEKKGLQGRIRIVGIDNTAPGMEASIPLTTVDLAKEWLGIRAIEQFVRKLAQPAAQPEKIILSSRMVVRKSG
ncbi:LacI family DNA-binding transcriptional regulator [Paenibacillus silvisoli]|uniref:LacI family DNA-binding transcriptional regulator n=1 Tax=Paenibacillus silvisoli TaxID=3110539 RepID=UPI002805E224|nr:LacI family DNA-binding transcriptional regulator [Paenibacillus silvisoli]